MASVLTVSPALGSTSSPSTVIQITCSGEIQSATIELIREGVIISGTMQVNGAFATYAASSLTPNSAYVVKVTAQVLEDGQPVQVKYQWGFATSGIPQPSSQYNSSDELHLIRLEIVKWTELFTRATVALEGIKADQDRVAEATEGIQADINALKVIGVDHNMGIVTRGTCSPCDDIGMSPVSRAIMINALKTNDQLKDVIREMQHPTALPKGKRVID